jgi:hypothetical protein
VNRIDLRFKVGDRAAEVLWQSARLASRLARALVQHIDRDRDRPQAVLETVALECGAEGLQGMSSDLAR